MFPATHSATSTALNAAARPPLTLEDLHQALRRLGYQEVHARPFGAVLALRAGDSRHLLSIKETPLSWELCLQSRLNGTSRHALLLRHGDQAASLCLLQALCQTEH